MKATAIANTNIALIKYWGKRDEKLILPQNSSISMTCDGLFTITTVEFSKEYKKDIIILEGEELKNGGENILNFLEKIRNIAKRKEKAKIATKTNFPIAAGLASSASFFASLTLAATKALGLNLSKKQLSILARQGSGSACRSIFEGFVEWRKGEKKDGSDSFAKCIAKKNWWPQFRMIVTIVSEKKKKVSSRMGMAQTVKTCPYYKAWLETIKKDLRKMRKGILEKNFSLVGRTAEENCLKMHALMMTTKPPIIYWNSKTMEIINSINRWREEGLECYFTIDAGPNVKVICLEKDQKKIKRRLLKIKGVKKAIVCKPGEGAKIIQKHLF